MGFSKQGYWSGLPFPPPEDLSNPGIEPGYPTLQADTLPSQPSGKPQLIAWSDVNSYNMMAISIIPKGEKDGKDVYIFIETYLWAHM